MPEFNNIEYANCACVINNMLLAATDLGLGSVYLMGAPMAIGEDKQLKRDLGIPDSFSPLAAVALGYAKNGLSKDRVLKQHITLNRV